MSTTTAEEIDGSRGIDWASVRAKLGPLVGLVFVVALFAALRPKTFLAPENFQIMLMQTTVVATAALGVRQAGLTGGLIWEHYHPDWSVDWEVQSERSDE